jgi:hypothetical protein
VCPFQDSGLPGRWLSSALVLRDGALSLPRIGGLY